ncbi:MAG: acyltransferase [Lachnospiraceae bacterium]|nr:acyltransferase [Lachnospiraceae bacterium]
MGDESGIGANTQIPSDTIIGKNVMLSRKCFILDRNHRFDRVDIPINDQGFKEAKQTIIEDDCWVGMNTLFTPGRRVRKGTIIAMGSVVTKDFPEYSIVGGNPAKLIKSRLNEENSHSH